MNKIEENLMLEATEVENFEQKILEGNLEKCSLDNFDEIAGNLIKMEDEDISESETTIIFCSSKNALYKKYGNRWYKYEITKQERNLKDKFYKLTNYVKSMADWLRDHKSLTDKRIKKIEKKWETDFSNLDILLKESLDELKKYVDLEIKRVKTE